MTYSGANLVGANLVGGKLVGGKLVGGKLVGANLVGGKLVGANLVGGKLVGANLVGGKPVFSGAQGCVFIPALKCKNQPRDTKRSDHTVSKLGYTDGSDFEMREYEKITPFITKIKNHEKYFSVHVTSCEPDALTPDDLVQFNKVCRNFKKDITAENVNDHLSKLRAINMPNLGVDLRGWMDAAPMDPRRLRLLNDHISELLTHAVVPMNTLGVMHNDLKSENIMMNRSETNARIIDWGLAGTTTPHQIIPGRYFMNNPVTFNRPFSTMIISSEIDELYKNHLEKTKLAHPATPEQLRPFVRDLYKEYRELAPRGHEYLTYIFESMFNLKTETASLAVSAAVEQYNAEILLNFTDPTQRQFMLHDYFDKVYRFNTDVWGTLSVFYSMFMMPRSHFLIPDAVYSAVLQHYRNMFINTVFANGHRRINVSEIVKCLRDINALIGSQQRQQPRQHQQPRHHVSRRHRKSSMKQKKVRFNVSHTRRKHRLQARVPTPHPMKGIMN
jgi:hypothetical protein